MTTAAKRHVLVVDDDPALLASCRLLLDGSFGIVVTEAADGDAAIARLESAPFHAVLSDFNLGTRADGVTVLRHAFERQPDALRILMTGDVDPRLAKRAREEAHVDAIIEKGSAFAERVTVTLLHGLAPGARER